MKITANTLKPRNPMVAPARFRKAGSHAASGGSQRQRAQRTLQRELKALDPHPRQSP